MPQVIYVRIRAYKNAKINGKNEKLYGGRRLLKQIDFTLQL